MTTKLKPKTKDWRQYARNTINNGHCRPACFAKGGHQRKTWPDMPAYLESYSMSYWFDIATKRTHG